MADKDVSFRFLDQRYEVPQYLFSNFRKEYPTMSKKMLITMVALSIFMVIPAVAQGNEPKCKEKDVIGSYASIRQFPDLFGNGTNVERTWLLTLNLNRDGTAYQYHTAWPDFHLLGLATPQVGSWKCRADGKIVVTVLNGFYAPVTFNPGTGLPTEDIELRLHLRITFLLIVEDIDNLKRVQFVRRRYNMTEDPTDPAAGTLDPVSFLERFYKRIKASDADLSP